MNTFDVSRQQANRELISKLTMLVNKHPSMRLGQILQNFGFVDRQDGTHWRNEFYIEPQHLLDRVERQMKKIEDLMDP